MLSKSTTCIPAADSRFRIDNDILWAVTLVKHPPPQQIYVQIVDIVLRYNFFLREVI
jgi:hypothetical protein